MLEQFLENLENSFVMKIKHFHILSHDFSLSEICTFQYILYTLIKNTYKSQTHTYHHVLLPVPAIITKSLLEYITIPQAHPGPLPLTANPCRSLGSGLGLSLLICEGTQAQVRTSTTPDDPLRNSGLAHLYLGTWQPSS